jgi:hypothetical protein
MKWAGYLTCTGEKRNRYRVLVGKARNRPLGRTRSRWDDNFKMDLKRNRNMVNMVMNF